MKQKLSPIKWAGGKKWLAPSIAEVVRELDVELFIDEAAGSVEVPLRVRVENPDVRIVYGDISPFLRTLYQSASSDEFLSLFSGVAMSYDAIGGHPEAQREIYLNQREMLRRMRRRIGEPDPAAAAAILFLMRTCFNGLFRVNKQGEFNTPWGKKKTVGVSNAEVRLFGKRLATMSFSTATLLDDFPEPPASLRLPRRLFYVDPPYLGTFSSYTAEGFGIESHRKLAEKMKRDVECGAYVIASNSWRPEVIDGLYDGDVFKVIGVSTRHSIAADPASRGNVREALIVSRNIPESALGPLLVHQVEAQ